MRRFALTGFLGLALYVGLAFADLTWSDGPYGRYTWGFKEAVETAQFKCDQLRQGGFKDWRVPMIQELLAAPKEKLGSGFFWTSIPVPHQLQGKTQAVVVDVVDRTQGYREIHSKQLVACVRGVQEFK